MPKLTLTLPRLHIEQQNIKREATRFNVLVCGRRWGKDVLLVDRLIEQALAGYPVAWFNPSYPMLTEVWRTLRHLLFPVIKRVDSQQHRLELITGGVIDMWSLDAFDSARGRKYKRVIINEAGLGANLQEAWEEVIRPMLSDYEGDAWFGGTPKGRNYFWKLYLKGQDVAQTEWRSWSRPTIGNPYINPREIEAARDDLPQDVFEQEYEADFKENQGSVFRNIAANMKAPVCTPDDHQGHTLVAGVDWAQKQDYTVISVVCADCKQEVELDRFNQISWSFQRDRLKTIWERWGIRWGYGEENSIGGPNIEALQEMGLDIRPFNTNGVSKGPLIKSLALALERQEVEWLDIAVATAELEAYEVKVSVQTGHSSYGAPPGLNDDTVIGRGLSRKAALEYETVGFW